MREQSGTGAGDGGMAYVMFTSGSTGRPKAAAIAQRAIVRLVRNTNYITLTVRQSGAGVERFV